MQRANSTDEELLSSDSALIAAQFTDQERVAGATAELTNAFAALNGVNRGVTVFGSARSRRDSPEYALTRELSSKLASRASATVITGGGPGLMEAANRGAADVGAENVGLLIELPHEQGGNKYITLPVNFRYFFTRKVAFVRYSTAFIAMPGGVGTLDELFEVFCLVQTEKVRRYPIVLFGTEFWGGLVEWMEHKLVNEGMISSEDLDLITVTDDLERVIDIARESCDLHDPASLFNAE